MKKVMFLFILVFSLSAETKFSDSDMLGSTKNILNEKQKVYTVQDLVTSLFSIQGRGEFETKKDYENRMDKILGNGIFYVYKESSIEYDIDKQIMKCYTPLQGGSTSDRSEPSKELIQKGYTGLVLELDFHNSAFPIVRKMESDNNKYSHPYAYISMDVEKAKRIKVKGNQFFHIIAVKITPDSLINKKTRDSSGSVNGKTYYELWAEIPSETIGTAIVSLNQKEIIFAYGISYKK